MTWVTVLTATFGAVLYALAYLASWIYGLFSVLASPLWILGHALLYVLLSPLRLLLKFEAILSYLTVAAIMGVVLGISIHYGSSVTVEAIHRWFSSRKINTAPRRRDSFHGRLLDKVKRASSPSDSNASDEDTSE
ncbi:hypothetical protein CBS63078_1005 [Aspergillus niger]|uniref:Uncharacterized protein n=3 Tax=Aspergillus TaxID=5052 RepID=A0A3F3QE00_9EURO|nr:uncharacterized protein BO96DRAFT_500078 [Aspergillus niger CBS 101883]XP_026630389.1 hypothetical protein BDQ94DRAFT_136298 [Aspergillus welwitschiae]KAI2818414.1 hypothetical protein CBS115989_5122 [Aspergillus niger]RDH22598.1 hypothetical protein M747DRAFT_368747 [Aspergillus niger ATCC 13496]RDK38969.1 hypothetical protein M752DRAFT_338718 [Aspergillus phoenicis ATCC 13157]KAI2832285.1 hypothetical protein CBS133816_1769 [Aspergillus niger]KAI2835754.1 hypothetical protein CBS11350_98